MDVRDSESLLLCGMLRDTRHLCAFIPDYEMSYLSIHLSESAAILCVCVGIHGGEGRDSCHILTVVLSSCFKTKYI